MPSARRRVVLLVALILGLGVTTGAGVGSAKPGGSGPALTVPAAALARSLDCHGDLAARTPVLLIPGTTLIPTDFAGVVAAAGTALATGPYVPAEPALAPYARSAAPAQR